VAGYRQTDVDRLLEDAGTVRHRGKIESTINNAKRVLEMRREFGSLAAYAWRHEPTAKTRPKRVTWAALKAMTTSPESESMSKDLKKRGWSFVGPTTVYAFMQAMGLVNDHVQGCSVREAALGARAKLVVPGP
jgi:DNA-3-methyladenine glycosylase I